VLLRNAFSPAGFRTIGRSYAGLEGALSGRFPLLARVDCRSIRAIVMRHLPT
jgi:hypothetical protein